MAVERCDLAPGLNVSRVITGLWQVADRERDGSRCDPDAAAAAMAAHVKAGFTTFDMADHYGTAEDITGTFLRRHGGSPPVQVLTKWVPPPGPLAREDARAAVERALARLGSDRIDLLQLHSWNYADLSYLDALKWLEELREEGKIRHVGVTNFDAAHLRVLLKSGIGVASNQVCFSLLDRRASRSLLPLCEEHGVKVLAYGTLAGGLLTDRYLGVPEPADLKTWSERKYKRFVDAAGGWRLLQDLLAVLHAVARRHGVSIANVASRHVLDQPAVGAVIVGARLGERDHIQDNLRLWDLSLDARDRAEIESVLQSLVELPGDCGDEYRRPPFLTASGDLSHHVHSFPPAFTPVERPSGRRVVSSGTPWEAAAGYARAVRQGDRILVSGTTATLGSELVGGDDAAAQTHFVLDKIEAAIQSLGGRLEDVVRTRIYVKNRDDWEAVARAHGQRFRTITPANTLVEARLVGERSLVEIEAEAIVSARRDES